VSHEEARANHEVVRTRAGDLAMRSIDAGEVMHPGVGPLVEARELYVRQSQLADRLRKSERTFILFDVGLGAGSNALAARAVAQSTDGKRLHLVSFERDLGALELALSHGADFGFDEENSTAVRAFLATGQHENARTLWQLRRGDLLEQLAVEPARADLVFWDPFSPRANPELWTVSAFAALRRVAAPGCTLATYSASTATRVALLLGGWAVGVGDSIGDKRQTTFAAVDARDLSHPLDRRWPERLSLPGAPLPPDAPKDAAARVAALPQFQF
jgi:queuine tRNA-ribosyltransferase